MIVPLSPRWWRARRVKRLMAEAMRLVYCEEFVNSESVDIAALTARLKRRCRRCDEAVCYAALDVAACSKFCAAKGMSGIEWSEMVGVYADIERGITDIELHRLKAELNLLKARVEFEMNKIGGEYSFGWAVYHAEMAKGGPISMEDRREFQALTNEIANLSAKIKRAEDDDEEPELMFRD